jgi:hypothetical protein
VRAGERDIISPLVMSLKSFGRAIALGISGLFGLLAPAAAQDENVE